MGQASKYWDDAQGALLEGRWLDARAALDALLGCSAGDALCDAEAYDLPCDGLGDAIGDRIAEWNERVAP